MRAEAHYVGTARPLTNWSLQATLWPGSLHLFVHDADDDEESLPGSATGTRITI